MPVVLCYGDSNTHGTVPLPAGAPRRRFDAETRWPGVLASRLGPGWRVIEEGLPGRTTCLDDPLSQANRNGLATLAAILESHRPIDVVVLMLGTNDTKARFGMTAADIARGVEMLARTILSDRWDEGCGPDGGAPRLLVVAPPHCTLDGPFDRDEDGRTARLSRALAPLLADIVRSLGGELLDAADVAEMSPIDGVHLDADGHRALGEAIATRIGERA